MSAITYQQWPAHLDRLQGLTRRTELPSVILIHGEELLCRQVVDGLLPVLVEGGKGAAGFESLDGASVSWTDVLERVNTFALLGGPRIVAVMDAKLFHGAKDAGGMVAKIEDALVADNQDKAARQLAALLGLLGLGFDDVSGKAAKLPKALAGRNQEGPEWLAPLVAHCQEKDIAIPAQADGAALLEQAIRQGFPPDNCLVITTDLVDKRRTLYKALDQDGLIVDCTVPKGERMADRKVQQSVLQDQLGRALERSGKTMAPGTFQHLQEKTGFDLRTFTQAVDKLIAFVGAHPTITPADVDQVLTRTKQDPIFELTNAVAAKDFNQAMFFFDSLLGGDFHPLQLLAALANQIRRLLVMKDFAQSAAGQGLSPGMTFNQFKSAAIPAMTAFDQKLQDMGAMWSQALAPPASDKKGKKPKKGKAKGKAKKPALPLELRLGANPSAAYPLFITFQKQARFTAEELRQTLTALHEADMLLKTGGRQPRLVFERLLMQICLPRQ